MNAQRMVDRLLESDPDDLDLKSYLHTTYQALVLYRTGRLVWTPDPAYARYIHPGAPLQRATVNPKAKVRYCSGSPTRKLIASMRGKFDVLIFSAWDWDTDEYVILNPGVLNRLQETAQPKLPSGC
jgi:hypothetical protein